MSFHIVEDGNYIEIYNSDEITQIVKNTVNYYQNVANKFREENLKLYDDAIQVVKDDYKDTIEQLEHNLSLSYGRFSSEKEKQAYADFTRRHMHDRMTSKANGGKAPYLIPIHTGIGTILKVKCQICGEEEDITDMEVW